MPMLTLNVPPPELKVNRTMGGSHWSYRHAKKQYQEDCQTMAMIGRKGWERIPVTWPTVLRIYLYLGKGRSADASDVGGWIKCGLDSLTDYLVWPDDSPRYFRKAEASVLRDWLNPRVDLYWGDDVPTLVLEAEAIALADSRGRRTVKAKP